MAYPLSRTGCAAPAEKMDAPWGKTHGCGPSFRGDAKHRTRNLEIPRCAIAHLRSGANAPSRNDYAARFDRKASISERSRSASRRSASDEFSTSAAAAPASAEAVETPTMLL